MKHVNKHKSKLFKLSTVKSLHKWLSLLVFIQLFIWLATGLFFNLMDHNKARGNHNKQAIVTEKIDSQRLLNPKHIIARSNSPVSDVVLVQRLGQPYYLLAHDKGLYNHFKSRYSLIDAYTGIALNIDKSIASKLAQATYKGSGDISDAVKLDPPIADMLKERNTVWQINFSDDVETSVYVDASSGRLVGHSNEDKRFVDFFFMLHFMDYPFLGEGSVGGFNNGQITFFALLTLVFCLTGFIWVIELLRKGRYKFS